MGIINLNEFCQRLAESGFVDPDTADERVDQWRELSNLSEDERKLSHWLVEQGLLTAFQAETLLIGLRSPWVIAPWRLVELVAAGRLGNVFRAVHEESGETACLKIFPAALKRDPLQVARMRRESRVAMQMDHPHIVRTCSLAQSGDLTFLVLESLVGGTLDQKLKSQSRLGWDEACRIAHQAAQGLHYLHRQQIVHRDVEPGNLWITPEDVVKVMEFSAARDALEYLEASDSGVGLSELGGGAIVGTFDYMAPEQAQSTHSADARSDIYSLGCVLYHCLTGNPPFPDTHPVRQMLRHANEPPVPVGKLAPETPVDVARLVLAMLSKKPEQRPATAEIVAGHLARILNLRGNTDKPAPAADAGDEAAADASSVAVDHFGTVSVVRLPDAAALARRQVNHTLNILTELVQKNHGRFVLLDLQRIDYLSSPALSMLIRLNRQVRQLGGRLGLCNLSQPVHDIFAVTQLTRLFEIFPTEADALRTP